MTASSTAWGGPNGDCTASTPSTPWWTGGTTATTPARLQLSGSWESLAGQLAAVLRPRCSFRYLSVLLVTDQHLHVVRVRLAGNRREPMAGAEAVEYAWRVERRQIAWVRNRTDVRHGTHEVGFVDGSWVTFAFTVGGYGPVVADLPPAVAVHGPDQLTGAGRTVRATACREQGDGQREGGRRRGNPVGGARPGQVVHRPPADRDPAAIPPSSAVTARRHALVETVVRRALLHQGHVGDHGRRGRHAGDQQDAAASSRRSEPVRAAASRSSVSSAAIAAMHQGKRCRRDR